MENLFEIITSVEKKDLTAIHDYSCRILQEAGMKFLSEDMLNSLEENGSKIDRINSIAFIPKKLIERKIGEFSSEIKSGKKHTMINGGVSFNTGDKIFCKFGSIAPRFYNFETGKEREASEKDLVNAIKLGQSVEEIGMVGCPMYIKELKGRIIDPNFTPIVNAMLLAHNTNKLGNSEVNSAKQLKYLMEMGIVLLGSLEEYRKNPIFLTAKESISPLLLDRNACEVLTALARNGLPAVMIPMPILGAGVPVNISGAAAVTNAEILGTMTAIRCMVPDAMTGGGSMASYMDMSGRGIKFNVMDAIKVDMILCQIYSELYGLDYGYGVYASDSKKLGSEVLIERVFKILGAFMVKKYNYVIGLFDQGMIFSPELALAELEIIKSIHELFKGLSLNGLDEDLMKEIKDIGPGGNFMSAASTLNNFKKTLRSEILDEVFDFKNKDTMGNIFQRANEKYNYILNNNDNYELPSDKSKEIHKIFSAAHKDITGAEW